MNEQIEADRILIKLWIYEIRERLVSNCTVSGSSEVFLEDRDRGIVLIVRSSCVNLEQRKEIPDCLVRAYKINKDILALEVENILENFDNKAKISLFMRKARF